MVVRTVAPRYLPICMAATPTPLLPAWTSRNSPDWSLPAARRPNQAVRKTVGMAAATAQLIPAGKGRTSDSPANAYSAYPPVPV